MLKNIFSIAFANGRFYSCKRLRLNVSCVYIKYRCFWLSGNHAVLSLTQEIRNWIDARGSQALRKWCMYSHTYSSLVSIYLLKSTIEDWKKRNICSKFTLLCEQLWRIFSKNDCKEFTCFEKLHSGNLKLY